MIGHKATKGKKGIQIRSKNFKALFRYHSHPLSHSLSLIISEFGYFLVFSIVCFVDLNQTFVCNNPNRIVIKSINRNRYDPFPKSDSLCIWQQSDCGFFRFRNFQNPIIADFLISAIIHKDKRIIRFNLNLFWLALIGCEKVFFQIIKGLFGVKCAKDYHSIPSQNDKCSVQQI